MGFLEPRRSSSLFNEKAKAKENTTPKTDAKHDRRAKTPKIQKKFQVIHTQFTYIIN